MAPIASDRPRILDGSRMRGWSGFYGKDGLAAGVEAGLKVGELGIEPAATRKLIRLAGRFPCPVILLPSGFLLASVVGGLGAAS